MDSKAECGQLNLAHVAYVMLCAPRSIREHDSLKNKSDISKQQGQVYCGYNDSAEKCNRTRENWLRDDSQQLHVRDTIQVQFCRNSAGFRDFGSQQRLNE